MTDKQLEASERIVPPPSITRGEAKAAPLTLRATQAEQPKGTYETGGS